MQKDNEFVITKDGVLIFYNGDKNIKELVLPEGVRDIQKDALKDLNAETVSFPSSFTTYNYWTMGHFSKTKTIKLPSTCKPEIASFNRLTNLENIIVDENNPYAVSIDGILYSKNLTHLICCPQKKEGIIKVNENTVYILKYAFYNCHNIEQIILGENTEVLQNYAFCGITNLSSPLYIPSKVREIDICMYDYSYYFEVSQDNPYFSSLDGHLYNKDKTSLIYLRKDAKGKYTIPSTVEKMGKKVFFQTSFDTIVIPKEVNLYNKNIDYKGLFCYCPSLRHLVFEDRYKEVKESLFFSNLYSNNDKLPNTLSLLASSFLPSQLSTKAKSMVIHSVASFLNKSKEEKEKNYIDDLYEKEWVAYFKRRKSSLYKLSIEDENILNIFINNKLLNLTDVKTITDMYKDKKNIDVSSRLLEYENQNFSFDEILKEREKAFNTNYDSVSYLKTQYCYKKIEDGTLVITSYRGQDTDIYIPPQIGKNKISGIGPLAFSPKGRGNNKEWRNNIVSITIPDSIKNIDCSAFQNIVNLKTLHLPSTLNICFGKMDSKGLTYGCDNLSEITIPEGIKTLPCHTFYSCNHLKKINLPHSLEKIDNYAFVNCSALEEIVIPPNVTFIGVAAFMYCDSLKKVTIPEKLERISPYAFWNVMNLKSVTLPPNLVYIGNYNFTDKAGFKIYGKNNTYAQRYAKSNGIIYQVIS